MKGTRRIEDCRVWVTGGRRGLGHAFAAHFAALGAEVHITSREPGSLGTVEAVDSLAHAARAFAVAHGTQAKPVTVHGLEMSDPASLDALVDAIRHHPPHVLVHAAHVFADHVPIVGRKPEDFARGLSTNVVSAYTVLRAAARAMGREGVGRILVVGSFATVKPGLGQVGYVTEKAALEGMVRSFAAEFATRGVHVNIVHPGICDTENVRERVPEVIRDAYAARTTAGRLLTPKEVVLASFSLCDPRHAGITGQSLAITGGADLAGLVAGTSGAET